MKLFDVEQNRLGTGIPDFIANCAEQIRQAIAFSRPLSPVAESVANNQFIETCLHNGHAIIEMINALRIATDDFTKPKEREEAVLKINKMISEMGD